MDGMQAKWSRAGCCYVKVSVACTPRRRARMNHKRAGTALVSAAVAQRTCDIRLTPNRWSGPDTRAVQLHWDASEQGCVSITRLSLSRHA